MCTDVCELVFAVSVRVIFLCVPRACDLCNKLVNIRNRVDLDRRRGNDWERRRRQLKGEDDEKRRWNRNRSNMRFNSPVSLESHVT